MNRHQVDEITGSLVEIMQGSIADLLPQSKVLRRAIAKGLDRLIKKVKITHKKVGERTLPDGTREPVIQEDVELEVYSRLVEGEIESMLSIFRYKDTETGVGMGTLLSPLVFGA